MRSSRATRWFLSEETGGPKPAHPLPALPGRTRPSLGAGMTMLIVPIALLVTYPLEALALVVLLVKAGIGILTTTD
jgi:hypothetical protein